MRQLVLNHVSIVASDECEITGWIADLASGMSEMLMSGISQIHSGLKMSEEGCVAFYEMLQEASEVDWGAETRDSIEFLRSLAVVVPLVTGSSEEIEERFTRCQEKTLSEEDGRPLLYCAISEGISCGFPSDIIWDSDQITVTFEELLPDVTIQECCERIDNLTKPSHVMPITVRHRRKLQLFGTLDALWDMKDEAFLNLTFLPDAREPMSTMDSIAFTKVVNALSRMDEGNLSNVKSVGAGVSEFRINFGPGYRIYFRDLGSKILILYCGTKQTQDEDVLTARGIWQTYSDGG